MLRWIASSLDYLFAWHLFGMRRPAVLLALLPVPAARAAGRSLLIIAMLQSLPAAAQSKDEPATKSEDIVVVGSDERDRDKQILHFVRGMTPAPGTRSLARFDTEKLCPQAVGLAPQYDKAITDRMRRVAAAARINVAREGCRYPNALVVFANDKAAMIAALHGRYPWLFRDSHGDPLTLGKEEGPAVAWHVNGLVTQDGVPLASDGTGIRTVRTTTPGSRLRVMVRPVYLMSIVVVERRGVEGLTATQIADYAAMRAFTDASPAGARETGAPTILTVLDAPMGSETPSSMTRWDLSFLRGLYKSPASSYSNAQRGSIYSYMRRQLNKELAGKK